MPAVTWIAGAAAIAFVLLGAAAERLAAVWPAEEASRRGPGIRTGLLAVASGAAAWGIVARSTLDWWVTGVHLLLLALLVVLAATDLEQRRLPHLVLDPLIAVAVVFVPFNPTVEPLSALAGAAVAVAFLGVLGVVIRSGVAMGDLYLVAPLGLVLGWPAIFVAVFLAALLSSATSLLLLATRRVGLKSYIPFGPFLVAGAVLTLLRDDSLLGPAAGVAVALANGIGQMLGA
jgi:prepilin signal peptidase PulO-like enzyme (type II secretory pathway)